MAFPAIWTKYLGPTDFKGSRVKATTIGNRSATLHWDDALDAGENHKRAALELAKRLGWTGTMIAADGGDAGYVYAFTRRTWESGGFADAEKIEVTK